MAYSELIKNFDRIRDYLRDFFVYGFKNRAEYDVKSARSYDNERRRIESWLGDYMSFHRETSGKSAFLSIDSRAIRRNPLYNAFKAKTFTANDVTLHFIVLDILADGKGLSVKKILEKIDAEYMAPVGSCLEFDESTVRKKLAEYVKLGLLCSVRSGKAVLYRRADDLVDLSGWREAIAFFSEIDPIGVIGYFLLDKYQAPPDCFRFKHHYILHAMESEVLRDLLGALEGHLSVELRVFSPKRGKPSSIVVFPLKIYISVQNARRYLMAYNYRFRRIMFCRLDSIRDVAAREYEPDFEKYRSSAESFRDTLWGSPSPKGTRWITSKWIFASKRGRNTSLRDSSGRSGAGKSNRWARIRFASPLTCGTPPNCSRGFGRSSGASSIFAATMNMR
jgi:DNA-binding transcriptional ArsR family regulator